MNYLKYLDEGGITETIERQDFLPITKKLSFGHSKLEKDNFKAYGDLIRKFADFLKTTRNNDVQNNTESLAFVKNGIGYYVSADSDNNNNYSAGISKQSPTFVVVSSVK